MRRYRSRSRALWWVTNGRAWPHPGWVEHRGLHFDEAPPFEPAADPGQDPAAHEERLPGAFVGPEVGVSLPVAEVDVGQPGPLVAEAATGAGQQHPGRHLDRQLARPGAHHFARGPDPVAQGETDELGEVAVQDAPANSWMPPVQSRSEAKASLPISRRSIRRPATDTITPGSCPGSSELANRLRQGGG